MQNQKCKELEGKTQENVERKTKEGIASQQSKYREFKVELDKIIKMLDKNADVSNHNYILLRLTYAYEIITCILMCSFITE